jgi:ParB family chromosome partitioning protein
MGKLDELKRTAGMNVLESASKREAPAVSPATLAALNPARMDGVSRSKAALEIPVAKIERDPSQPREEFDEAALAGLAESIRDRGLLQPIRVRWNAERETYILIAGERRWRAARMAGLTTMTCVVDDRDLSPAERLADQVIENLQREDLNPLERAHAFQTLIDLNGWSGNQLAKELGIAQSGVVQSLALLSLPEPIQADVERGTIPPATAYELSKVPDQEERLQLAARVVNDSLSRAETAEAVRAASGKPSRAGKGKGTARSRKATSRVVRTAAGRATFELRKGAGAGPDALLALAREVVRVLEAERLGDQAAA